MAKLSHGATHGGVKKKNKKRPVLRPVAPTPAAEVKEQPVERQQAASSAPAATVVQFRPRARDGAASRATGGRPSAAVRAFQQVVDYSYVYTDLKIIGGIAFVLVGGLVALSFVIH